MSTKVRNEVRISRGGLKEHLRNGVSPTARENIKWLLGARPRALNFTFEIADADPNAEPTVTLKFQGRRNDGTWMGDFVVPRGMLKSDDDTTHHGKAASVDTSPRAHEIARRRYAAFYNNRPDARRPLPTRV